MTTRIPSEEELRLLKSGLIDKLIDSLNSLRYAETRDTEQILVRHIGMLNAICKGENLNLQDIVDEAKRVEEE